MRCDKFENGGQKAQESERMTEQVPSKRFAGGRKGMYGAHLLFLILSISAVVPLLVPYLWWPVYRADEAL